MADDEGKKPDLNVVHVTVPPSELAKALGEYKKSLPAMMEYNRISAKLWRAKYLALRDEGFTSVEAIQLCHLT